MNWWQYLLLANLYLLLFYGFYALLLRSETFFKLNRIYLVTSVLLSFFIPLIHADWIRNLFITQKVEHTLLAYKGQGLVLIFRPQEAPGLSIGQLLLIIYATGIVVLTIRFIWQLAALKRIIDQPLPNQSFSFFKKIRIGNTPDKMGIIAAHEQVHAREWHSADVLLMETVAIINWFNPVVYFYRSGIKHIHEFIADRQALNSSTSKADYALLLLSETLKAPAHQLVNSFFNHSLLKQRIIMLQKNQSQRMALLKYGLSAPLFALMLILSSATIGSSKTAKSLNKKVEEVFLTPASAIKTVSLGQPEIVKIKKKAAVATPVADTASAKNKETVFSAVDVVPVFSGGMEALYQFLIHNIKYPESMKKNNIQGKVFVTFVVEKDGALADIKVVRGIGYGADEEAIRVLQMSPKWIPGNQNGRSVRVQYTLPISFTLVNDKPAPPNTSGNTAADTTHGQHGNTSTYVGVAINDGSLTVGGDLKDPLYIVNGLEMKKSDLGSIDPKDIQSIDVLKDSTATKKYGQKGANGVIIVKTKKK